MLRLALLLTLGSIACAQQNALVEVAKNPYDLARYLQAHVNRSDEDFDWRPLWKAWHADDHGKLRCWRECSIDLITVLNPEQVILAVRGLVDDKYIRFLRAGADWRYGGTAGTFKKNYRGRHELVRIGDKPFLAIAGQGANGSNWDSEVEQWLDLTQPELKPVFGFTTRGDELMEGLGRRVLAHATPGPGGNEVDSIELDLEIISTKSYDRELGHARYRATYERKRGASEFTLNRVEPFSKDTSAITNEDFKKLSTIDVDDDLTKEQLLVYALPGLKAIASGSNGEDREWLEFILEQCKDTPEKRALLDLLGHTH